MKNCLAMILAGGRGERLGSLTAYVTKPAVTFGGKYRIIDFTLNNCRNSGINNVGVLTQYLPTELHSHIRKVQKSDMKFNISLLPPKAGIKYSGTADSVYHNIDFMEQFEPDHVLILSGDHVYEMNYRDMFEFHLKSNADVTIASTSVPFNEASRFGILSSENNGFITRFEEKPRRPKSNLASIGVYIFKWSRLKKYLVSDNGDEVSAHDFGKDIIPKMLCEKEKLYTYTFHDYWKDIGTVHSLWEANMDMLHTQSKILSLNYLNEMTKMYRSAKLEVNQSFIMDYRKINGIINSSIISENVNIGEGSEINDCVIMDNASIGCNVKLNNVIVGSFASIMDDVEIGIDSGIEAFTTNNICSMGVSLVSPHVYIEEGLRFSSNSHIDASTIALCFA